MERLVRRAALAAFVVFVGTAGCSSSTAVAPPPVDAWIDVLDQIARARCARAVRCTDDREHLYRDVCGPPTPDESYWRHVFGDGEQRLDEDAAAACLAGLLADTPCWYTSFEAHAPTETAQAGSTVPNECGVLTVPARANGESCAQDWVNGGAWWAARSCRDGECLAGAVCGATCVSFGGVGSDCTAVPCASGLHCDNTTSICRSGCLSSDDCVPAYAVCVAGACVADRDLPGAGERCADAIDYPPMCGSDAMCRVDGLCGPVVAVGAHCDVSTSACDGGAVCDPATSTCLVQCGGVSCPLDTPYCSSDGSCTADASQIPCPHFDGWVTDTFCPPGYGCFGDLFRCTAFARIGSVCDANVICAPGSSCSGGMCTRRVGPGQACGTDGICPSDYHCLAGVCVYRQTVVAPLGAACDATTACTSGRCLAGVCAWPSAGTACSGPSECEAGCVDGVCAAAFARDGDPCGSWEGGQVCDPAQACVPSRYNTFLAYDWICRASCPAP